MLIMVILISIFAICLTLAFIFSYHLGNQDEITISMYITSGAILVIILIISIVLICLNCNLENKRELYNLETEQYQYIIDNNIYEDDIISFEYKEFIENVFERNSKLKSDKLYQNSLWVGWFIPNNINEYKEVIIR